MIYLLAILIGVAAGLRVATPVAAVSWGAWLGWIDLGATPLGFLGNIIAVIVITLLAICGLTHRQGYFDLAMAGMVGPILSLVVLITLGTLFGSF